MNFPNLEQAQNILHFLKYVLYYNWGSLFEPIQSTAFSLNLRELSNPIESAFGFHLVYVYGKRMNRLPPFEDYKGELQKFIRSRRGPEFENSLKHYESRLVTNYKLIIIQENIFSLFNYLKEKLKSNKFQLEDLLKVDFVPPLCNISGHEYNLTWFKDKIKRGSILSKSPITSGRDLLKAIEHFIFRHLSMEASKEKHSIWQVRNRQKARNQIIEELKRKIIDKIKSETSNTNLNEYLMMDSLLLQYEIEINESFIKTYK